MQALSDHKYRTCATCARAAVILIVLPLLLAAVPKLAAVALVHFPAFQPTSDVTSIPSAEVGAKSGALPGGKFVNTTSTTTVAPAPAPALSDAAEADNADADAATAPGVKKGPSPLTKLSR